MTSVKRSFAALIILVLLGLGINYLAKAPTEDLTEEEYDIIETELLEIAASKDPRAAMEELRKRSEKSSAVESSCHSFGHAIGHAAYDKYASFGEALMYQSEFCNSAYIHGVIEEHFAKSSDVVSEMAVICSQYPEAKFQSAQCYHGVGHGVMFYTNNDLPKALGFCANYTNTFARYNCLMGVFMENFSSDRDLHNSLYVNESNPFYPCQEQTAENKQVCYLWAPSYYLGLHKKNYSGALAWCKTAEPPYQSICALGVGGQAMRENIGNPKMVESVCTGAKSFAASNCIAGMTHIYISHYGSPEPARKLCEQMTEVNRKTCYATIKGVEILFD